MRANFLTRLMALAMVLMMVSIPAMAENCALCGKDAGEGYYLCAACMLGLLEEKDVSGGLEITGAEQNEKGNVLFTWQDEANNGPYTVQYELLEAAPVPFGWTAATGVTGTSWELKQLAPGVSYVLTVTDASGNQAQTIYLAKAPENGNEIGARIEVRTRIFNGSRLVEIPFSAAEIVKDNGWENGLYVHLTYSMLVKTRRYDFTLTVEAPNGFADTVLSGDITLNRGKSVVEPWDFISLADYFGRLNAYYGEIPLGEYTVTLNFDGKPAWSQTFMVQE